MKQLLYCAVASLAILSTIAKPARRAMTPEERKAADERLRQFVAVPGSQKGLVAIENLASVDPKIISTTVSNLHEEIALNFKVEASKEPFDIIKAAELKNKLNAQLAVFIVADDRLPTELCSPSDGWALVNCTKLAKTADVLNYRFPIALRRAFYFAAGASFSQYPGNILSTADWHRLDAVREKGVPVDVVGRVSQHLKEIGVTPVKMVRYRKACEEGWAPKPVNVAQQQIWDKVHAIPSKPLKIEFDPKRDAGK